MNLPPASGSTPAREAVAGFLAPHGLDGPFELIPLAGGANNRVYRLHRTGGDYVLKSYFQQPGDSRDRFGAERAFYRWAWSQGVRRTPEPVAWETERRWGLFGFVAGRKLEPAEVDGPRVREALQFLGEINAARATADAQAMPRAAEACFSLADHCACIERRVGRLAALPATDDLDGEAQTFVQTELVPCWARLRERLAPGPTPGAGGLATPLASGRMVPVAASSNVSA